MYNAPAGSVRTGEAIQILMENASLLRRNAIIGGDMNLHHTDWDRKTVHATRQATGFTSWVAETGGSIPLM